MLGVENQNSNILNSENTHNSNYINIVESSEANQHGLNTHIVHHNSKSKEPELPNTSNYVENKENNSKERMSGMDVEMNCEDILEAHRNSKGKEDVEKTAEIEKRIAVSYHPVYVIEDFLEDGRVSLLDYICDLCKGVFYNPVLDDYGNPYCKSCIEKYMEYNNCFCPKDFTKKITKLQPVAFINDCIQKRNMYCVNSTSGCKWTGKCQDLNNHLEYQCSKQLISCDNNGCREKVAREFLSFHKDECSYKIIECAYCKEAIQKYNTNVHHSLCNKYIVKCDLCSKEVVRENIEHHIKQECPESKVDCDYKSVGCCFSVKRKSLKDHKRENIDVHNLLLMKRQLNFESVVNERINTLVEKSVTTAVKRLFSCVGNVKKIFSVNVLKDVFVNVFNEYQNVVTQSKENKEKEDNLTNKKRYNDSIVHTSINLNNFGNKNASNSVVYNNNISNKLVPNEVVNLEESVKSNSNLSLNEFNNTTTNSNTNTINYSNNGFPNFVLPGTNLSNHNTNLSNLINKDYSSITPSQDTNLQLLDLKSYISMGSKSKHLLKPKIKNIPSNNTIVQHTNDNSNKSLETGTKLISVEYLNVEIDLGNCSPGISKLGKLKASNQHPSDDEKFILTNLNVLKENRIFKWKVHLLKVSSWCAIGIAVPNVLKTNEFKYHIYDIRNCMKINNGCFMIDSVGYLLNSNNFLQNKIRENFSFKTGDTVEIVYNSKEETLEFFILNSNLKVTLTSVNGVEGMILSPAAVLNCQGDGVEFEFI